MMCEFHGSNGNGFGDIWWTDKFFFFSNIDFSIIFLNPTTISSNLRKSIIYAAMLDLKEKDGTMKVQVP